MNLDSELRVRWLEQPLNNAVGPLDYTGLVHTRVGGFTPGCTSFLVMNPDFRFALAMDIIVCTSGVGNVLRTTVCTSPPVFGGESVMVLAGICHDGRTQFKIVQEILNAVKYRDEILDPILLPFLQQGNCNHVFQHENVRFHIALVCQAF